MLSGSICKLGEYTAIQCVSNLLTGSIVETLLVLFLLSCTAAPHSTEVPKRKPRAKEAPSPSHGVTARPRKQRSANPANRHSTGTLLASEDEESPARYGTIAWSSFVASCVVQSCVLCRQQRELIV